MELHSSLALVSSANELLDSIAHYDEENLLRLQEMRGLMLQSGFDAPFAGVLAKTATEMEELSPAEAEDLKKQVGNIRYIASLKKSTLNRVRIAIAAHRLAKHLGDNHKCPISGDFIRRLADAGDFAILAYREMMDTLEGYGTAATQAIATVEYEHEGETKTASMRLPARGNAELAAKGAFGDGARIVAVKIQKGKSSIIKGKGARIAILTHFVTSAAAEVRNELDAKERQSPEVSKYNSILAQNRLIRDARLDLAEGFENVKKTLEREELMERKKEGGWKLTPDLEKEINKRRKYAHEEVLLRSKGGMWECFFVNYMKSNAGMREAEKGIPGLAARPGPEQLAPFAKVDIGIPNSAELVQKKIEAEGKAAGMDVSAFGAGFAVAFGKAAPQRIAKLLGMAEQEVEKAGSRVASLSKGRGGEFLSKLGKKKVR
jgi:hypothetical protein